MKANTVKVEKNGQHGYHLDVCIEFKAYKQEWSVYVLTVPLFDAETNKIESGPFQISIGGYVTPEFDCNSIIRHSKQLSQFAKFLESFRNSVSDLPVKGTTVKKIKSLAEAALERATR